MVQFDTTSLWLRTLAAQHEDSYHEARERLRAAFLSFRGRAELLAAEIARDLPDFTVHDITHIDALWQMADLIVGPEYAINPAEAFVLGGAFLTHDLGNALAAYPDGVGSMYASTIWRDAVSLILRRKLGRAPSTTEFQKADPQLKLEATSQVLRMLHASQAERLALVSWKDSSDGTEYYLIDDVFLRQTYGRLIGRLADSHWWNVERLRPEFDIILGAATISPHLWTVDPLKIACILRVADAAHLDQRRAPRFLRAIRKPTGESNWHWIFQGMLQQPMLTVDRLVYTSARPFDVSEAPAWWLCFDALRTLDTELVGTDSVLADCSRSRFAARAVQGAEDAARLSRWVQTDGWEPVDTRIKVTDVAELASRIGGAQLYGNEQVVPLRELIQNSTDAVRARRHIESRAAQYGQITVRLGRDSESYWVEVSDDGIGMTSKVMTGPLLDFGSSFWSSEAMLHELPGLASSRFESTGKYGIGFFSLFMWGDHLRVVSRSYREAAHETKVLEFTKGLHSRPILRRRVIQKCSKTQGLWLEFGSKTTRNHVPGYSTDGGVDKNWKHFVSGSVQRWT